MRLQAVLQDWSSILFRWKDAVRRLKQESYALYLAYHDARTPLWAKLWLVVVVGYAFSPIDLIPDFIPVLGLLDDMILLPLGIYIALRLVPRDVMNDCREQARQSHTYPVSRRAGLVIGLLWVIGITVLIVWLTGLLDQIQS